MALLKTGVSGSANASVGTGASASRSLATSMGGGSSTGPGGWHPTIIYMLALVVAEVLIVGFLSRHLLRG